MGRRTWFKVFAEETLHGKLKSLTCEEFGTAMRILCMASDNVIQGEISYAKNIPFSVQQMAGIANCTVHNFHKTLLILEKKGTIFMDNGIIKVKNWHKYQSEYERQKPYRVRDKVEKLQHEVTTQSYNPKLQIEVEVDREEERTKDLKTYDTSPINGEGRMPQSTKQVLAQAQIKNGGLK
jgi:DNA-binding transcriptional regulator YhcF (GntR family)